MELYLWMKNLTVFYLLLVVVMNLVEGSGYEKYLRFYLGLLLILFMVGPILSFLSKDEAYASSELEKKIEKEMERVWESGEE